MLSHPTIIREYMGAHFEDRLRRAEAAATARETRLRTRPWSHIRLPGA
jgi:hypothetical protein